MAVVSPTSGGKRTSATLTRAKNLSVIDIPLAASDALAALADRGMRLQCMIQDGQVQIFGDEGDAITIDPIVRMAPAALAR